MLIHQRVWGQQLDTRECHMASNLGLYYDGFWVNHHISITWNKTIWGWFPLHSSWFQGSVRTWGLWVYDLRRWIGSWYSTIQLFGYSSLSSQDGIGDEAANCGSWSVFEGFFSRDPSWLLAKAWCLRFACQSMDWFQGQKNATCKKPGI